MKIEDLKGFITKAKKVVKKSNTLPVLDNCLVKDGKIYVSNFDIVLSQKVDIDGYMLIPFAELAKIVQKVKKGNIDFNYQVTDGSDDSYNAILEIKTEKGNFKFTVGINPIYFIDIDFNISEHSILTKENVELVKKAVNYTGDNDLRPVYDEILIAEENIVATNGHYLCFYKHDGVENEYMVNKNVVPFIDNGFDYLVSKTVNDSEENSAVYYVLQDENGLSIIYRKFEGTFLNWKAVIPSEDKFETEIKIGSKELLSTLDACEIALNKTSNLMKFGVDVDNSKLTVSTQDIDFGMSYSNDLSIEVTGENINIYMKHNLLIKIVKTEKDKEYKFNFTEPDRAMIINNKVILMPIILND